jgi:hypothetical protein
MAASLDQKAAAARKDAREGLQEAETSLSYADKLTFSAAEYRAAAAKLEPETKPAELRAIVTPVDDPAGFGQANPRQCFVIWVNGRPISCSSSRADYPADADVSHMVERFP